MVITTPSVYRFVLCEPGLTHNYGFEGCGSNHGGSVLVTFRVDLFDELKYVCVGLLTVTSQC